MPIDRPSDQQKRSPQGDAYSGNPDARDKETQDAEKRYSTTRNPENGNSENGHEETAAGKFLQEVASKQSGLDDYDSEEDLWSGGYSPKAMVGTLVLLVLPAIVSQMTFGHAMLAIAAIWVIGVIRYTWRRLGVHYHLTTQRFIHQTGLLTRQTDRIEVIDIDDVSFTQGPVQRMFGVGTIRLTGSDRTHPHLSMDGIANVTDVAGLIDDIRRKERRRRSLHIESI